MYGKVKHTIRKHIEGATFWYITQDHSMNVCKDVVKRRGGGGGGGGKEKQEV